MVDVEAIIVAFLAAHPDVVAVAGENAVSTELPADPVWPRIRITLTGGQSKARGWLMSHNFVLESWADTKVDALTLLGAAALALETELDSAQVAEGTVTGCTQTSGVSWAPDPVSSLPRYLTTFEITTHPNP